ncbi:MAG: hypothetical protein H0T71_08785 [Acidobacteria bacterium]|nr:hypothetical protein [Acidobacteriota bacterium]
MRAACAVVFAGLVAVLAGAAPRFFPDDPLWSDDDAAFDASKVTEQADSNGYDFITHTFLKPGERRDVRAMNLNTLDEVPDSSWFTNRIGRGDIPLADLVRGPDRGPTTISLDGWVVAGGKGSGIQPGFRMTDPSGQLYQIEVDPPQHPEMASGAEVIGTAFFHAFGFHTVDVYLAELDANALKIAPTATIRDAFTGKRRPLAQHDLDDVFDRAARHDNGKYRVLVSRFAAGKPLGNFRYYGTRPDDPNDIVPHEHRRELRGARVLAAWLNHDDSRGVNSLDMLETRDGRGYIKHYMFDFGSILGSGTVFAQRQRAGHEYIFEHSPGWRTLATLGLHVRPWMKIDYPDVPPAVGRFESDAFDPTRWKPEYPNPAFDNLRPDDAFWAARIVARFSDAAVRALVEKAHYSDPRATDYLTEALLKRRQKVLATWLNGVNPVVDLALSSTGELTFGNAAVAAGVADAATGYTLQWFRFDNDSDTRINVAEADRVTALRAVAPASLLAAGSEYIGVEIISTHLLYASWTKPAVFYFRRAATGWIWVGAERR